MEKNFDENPAVQVERFQFVLSINDFIICQRYFKIGGYKERSIESVELMEAGNRCVEMIKNDLKLKSMAYFYNSAPQVYRDKEEMINALDAVKSKGEKSYRQTAMPVPTFIVLENSEDVYVWDGENANLYEGKFNRADYVSTDDAPSNLKFEFLVDNRPVFSEIIDASMYPRFVRNNIDLSNQKNRYRTKENFSIVEANMIDIMNEGRSDLIYPIISELAKVCSYNNVDDYTTQLGDSLGFWRDANGKVYETDITRQNIKMMRKAESQFQKKHSKKKNA